MAGSLRPAVFLDRDGTIIEDRNYLADPAGVRLLPGAAAAIASLNAAGWPVIVVTNQSGIGRGLLSTEDYEAIRERIDLLLSVEGARVIATYHCPHDPDSEPPCECRKPLPGLFLQASQTHGLDLARSHYVGDRLRDVLPGIGFGGSGYLLRSTREEIPPVERLILVDDLRDAVRRILAQGMHRV